MDEYEQLEKELKIQYETYLCHFRNISYLESLKGETSSSDYVNENVMDSINKSAVEEVQKTSFVSYLFSVFLYHWGLKVIHLVG